MRVKVLAAFLAAAAVVAACKRPAAENLAEKIVNIDVDCSDIGVVATITPWRVEMPKNGQIKWVVDKLEKANDVDVRPTPGKPWPFVEGAFKTRPGRPAFGKNLKPNTAPGTYKYTISTICYRDAGVQDTVIIDPDMIIPTLLEQGPGQ